MPLLEQQLISRIRRAVKSPRTKNVIRGIGDDCALLRAPRGHDTVVTTDFSLEAVHFRREWHPAEAVGHRCLARGLSDIAAMGADPIAAFLSLALPPDLDQKWVDGFLRGFSTLARKFGVTLAGGDTAQSPAGVLADVVVLGSVARGKAVLRAGARVGDDIYVTGKLGMGITALKRLLAGEPPVQVRSDKSTVKHFRPIPRLSIGRFLREQRLASSMIDVSDGLSTDLAHICDESRVSAWIAEEAIPIASGSTLEDALHGGDEYELIFTASPRRHNAVPKSLAGVPITWIGTVTQPEKPLNSAVWLINNDRGRRALKPLGWQHFAQQPTRRKPKVSTFKMTQGQGDDAPK